MGNSTWEDHLLRAISNGLGLSDMPAPAPPAAATPARQGIVNTGTNPNGASV